MEKRTVRFLDGFQVSVGDRVSFDTRYGSKGKGTVIGFNGKRATLVIIEPDANTEYGPLDRWPLKEGGFYNRISSHGINGGEIRRD